MSTQRDPRRDPRPGDVVQRGKFKARVHTRIKDLIWYICWGPGRAGELFEIKIHYWQLWADNKAATVLHAAPEEPTR